ncbi:MAG: GNAT family N-acetyltransferase [Gammaproteobacteria bacterium]|nr:GNAT family N-acetyltransferase [Gammaproteobacteria bacterium]
MSSNALQLTVVPADFAGLRERLIAIRKQVFVAEQGIPLEIELDERDVHCRHVLVVADGTDVGTGRIDIERGGRIGRVAVLKTWRRRGVGEAVMQGLHDIARAAGLARVYCHAQESAVPFYLSLGYQAEGESFLEVGIVHLPLALKL